MGGKNSYKIKKFYEDTIDQINEENKDLFHNFVNAIDIKNKEILENKNTSTTPQ